jgi:hypothetical protein
MRSSVRRRGEGGWHVDISEPEINEMKKNMEEALLHQ